MDLKDLYRDVIVDHNRNPRNFRPMADADRRADARGEQDDRGYRLPSEPRAERREQLRGRQPPLLFAA